MTAAEAVAQYRKSAGALRRMRCWAGSPPRTQAAAIKHQKIMADALETLRGLLSDRNMTEIEDRLREERRLLDSALNYGDDYDPEGAARDRGKAKHHQYKVRMLIRRR